MHSIREPPSTLPIDPETIISHGQHVLDVAREDGVYATLHMRSPSTSDIVLDIQHEHSYKIGRAPSSHIVLADARVSSTHFTLHTICVSESVDELCFLTDTSSNGTYVRYACLSDGTPSHTKLVGRNACVLLSDGDDIEIRHVATFSFKQHYRHRSTVSQLLRDAQADFSSETWTLSNRLIGSGSFGHVLMAHNRRTGQQACCKIVKRTTYPQQLLALEREVEVLQGLSHPNVISTLEVASSSTSYYLFCELLCGGDCFSYWHAPTTDKSEIMIAFFVYQMLQALDYLHERGIVHRDIKLENVLMAHCKDGCRVVLTDFGLARRTDEDKQGRNRMVSVVGTVTSMAPEVIEVQSQRSRSADPPERSGYGVEVDLWSLGVLIHEVLLDYSPFVLTRDMSKAQRIQAISKRLDFTPRTQDGNVPSELAQSFVTGLLQPDPTRRMTIQQALLHPWLARHAKPFGAQYAKLLEPLPRAVRASPGEQFFQTPATKRKPAVQSGSSDKSDEIRASSPCGRLAKQGAILKKRRILIDVDVNSVFLQC